jgi:hypothetical protein
MRTGKKPSRAAGSRKRYVRKRPAQDRWPIQRVLKRRGQRDGLPPSPRQRPGPITTGRSCCAKVVEQHLLKTNDSAYGSRPALGRRCGGNFKHTSALSRRAAPEAVPICFAPEGVGNADAQCTRSLVCKVRVAHELETARHRKHPAFPHANGFNGLLRALPGERALLPPSFAGKPATLVPASGHQDHAPSPSAKRLSKKPLDGFGTSPPKL